MTFIFVLITVAAFNTALEAHIVRSRLEVEGIECLLANEQILGVHPGLNFALGGVQLKVREEDHARALAILNGEDDDVEDDQPEDESWHDWDTP